MLALAPHRYALCSWFRQNEAVLPAWQRQPSADGASCRANQPTAVVMLTTAPDPATCAAFGACRCLSKPLSPQCFAHAMRSWLVARQYALIAYK